MWRNLQPEYTEGFGIRMDTIDRSCPVEKAEQDSAFTDKNVNGKQIRA